MEREFPAEELLTMTLTPPRTRKTWLWLASPVVLVGLGIAGFLISPFFIRPTVVEELPPAQGSGAVQVLARGSFDEKDAVHRGSGTASLVQTADGKVSVRFEDFSVTNGPDLFVFLSAHPSPSNSAELHQGGLDINLGELKAPQGAFSYEVPADVDLRQIKSVAVYCRAFRVMFSSAELRPI